MQYLGFLKAVFDETYTIKKLSAASIKLYVISLNKSNLILKS